MSREDGPALQGKRASVPVNDPSFTVDEFCHAERMSRSMLYRAWKEGWGPNFYWVGVTRRIPHHSRLKWQREREAAAQLAQEQGEVA
jgi:hypothetical protein